MHAHHTCEVLLLAIALLSAAQRSAQEDCHATGEPNLYGDVHDEHAVLASICAPEYFCDGLQQALEEWGFATRSGVGWDDERLCQTLSALAIGRVHFVGDAHMRQLFVAAAGVLTGNFFDAALDHSARPASCENHGQYSQREECVLAVQDTVTACGLHLRYHARQGFNVSLTAGSWPSTSDGRTNELKITNVEPGTSLTEWRWALHRQGSVVTTMLRPSMSCEAWMRSRAYGSPSELFYSQGAARMGRCGPKPSMGADASKIHAVETNAVDHADGGRHDRLCDLSGQHTAGEWRWVWPRRAQNRPPVCCLEPLRDRKIEELNFSESVVDFCGQPS